MLERFPRRTNAIDPSGIDQIDFNPIDRMHRHTERHPFLTKIAIGWLAIAALQSGSIVDRALDAVSPHNVAEVVQSAGLSSEPKAIQIREAMRVGTDGIVSVDEVRAAVAAGQLDEITVDGVPVGDYESPEAIYSFVNGSKELQLATTAVTSLMERVDSGEYESIIAESKLFENNATFLDDAHMQQAEEAINNATSNDEIAAILQKHMQFYDIDFILSNEGNADVGAFDPNTRISATKRSALEIVHTFKALPKELTELAGIETIMLGDREGAVEAAMGAEDMRLGVASKPFDIFMALNDPLNGTDNSIRGNILHEVSHGLANHGNFLPNRSAPIVGQYDNRVDDLSSSGLLLASFRHLANPVLGRAAPSGYGLTSDSENIAEAGRGVMDPNTNDGFVTPSEWRNFQGESNKSVLSFLVQLEAALPGSAAYFIAHNANLVPPHLLDLYMPN